MTVESRSPRSQRKALYTADAQERRRRMTVLLSRELRKRFQRRSLPIRKGDTARVLSGSYVGREERVAKISRRAYTVTLENITLKTGEQKAKALPLRPSHLVLTKLNLADPWRRRLLKAAESELTPEELGRPPAEGAPAGPPGGSGPAAGATGPSPKEGAP